MCSSNSSFQCWDIVVSRIDINIGDTPILMKYTLHIPWSQNQ